MKIRLACGLLLSSFIIVGCETTPTRDSVPAHQTIADAHQMLIGAETLDGVARQAQILAAASLFMDLGEAQKALDTSAALQPNALDDALYAKQTEIQSRANRQLGNIFAAKGLLEKRKFSRLVH